LEGETTLGLVIVDAKKRRHSGGRIALGALGQRKLGLSHSILTKRQREEREDRIITEMHRKRIKTPEPSSSLAALKAAALALATAQTPTTTPEATASNFAFGTTTVPDSVTPQPHTPAADNAKLPANTASAPLTTDSSKSTFSFGQTTPSAPVAKKPEVPSFGATPVATPAAAGTLERLSFLSQKETFSEFFDRKRELSKLLVVFTFSKNV
jgi:hypothetical protein